MPDLAADLIRLLPAGGYADLWETRSYADGEIIFREGDEADALGIIQEGQARIEVDAGEIDSDPVLARVQAGDIIGELALLDGGRRSASVIAEGVTRVRLLTSDRLAGLEADDPALAAKIYRTLGASAASKLRQTNDRLASVLQEGRDAEVERQVAAAREASTWIAAADDTSVEALLDGLAITFAGQAEELARLTVETTGIGNVVDKTAKNQFASLRVREQMRGNPGIGSMGHSSNGIEEFASPAGVVFGLIPVTNPAATAIFKALICLQGRNAPILSFPRRAAEVGMRVDGIFQQVLRDHGWPGAAIQTVTCQNSRKRTEAFFRHPGVDLILATGGCAMVKAAYGSGKPAYGVGSGNAPCLIAEDADVAMTARMVVTSKSFDNGLICGSEHNLVVHDAVAGGLKSALEISQAAVLDENEVQRFRNSILTEDGTSIRRKYIGQGAARIAAAAGITRPWPVLLIVVPSDTAEILSNDAMAGEKMAPVLSLFEVPSNDAGFDLCQRLLEHGGRGHTAVIHTADDSLARKFASIMPASRILANTPATQGVIGLTTGLTPSLTLGCGFLGGNSTTDNVTYTHLRNLKRLARHVEIPTES